MVADREEVVRRLELPFADDVHLVRELETERLVERAALRRVGDANHGVQEVSHGWILG